MRIYPDPQKIAAKLREIPRPLQAKALHELDAVYEAKGFKAVAAGEDSNGAWCDVNIKPGTSLQQTYEFLNEVSAGAVTVQACDITRLFGKNPVSLSMQRLIEQNGERKAGVELLEIDNLADAIIGMRRTAFNGTGTADEGDTSLMVSDMVHEGILDANEEQELDRWLEPAPQQMGLGIGIRSDRNGEMDGEWAPDSDLAEWEGE